MRILHLLSQTEITGAEIYAQALIQSQHSLGFDLHTISDKMHVAIPGHFLSLKISTGSFFTRLSNILKIRNYLIQNQIQIIHCHSRGAARHAYWAKLGLKIAQITTIHGRQHFSWSKRLFNIYGELQIAVCENVKRAQIEDFKISESEIQVLRNPFKLNSLGTKVESQSNPTQTKKSKIAFLGRSTGPKGQRIEEIGFTLFKEWLTEHPELQISIIAPFPERFTEDFLNLIKGLNQNFNSRIEVLGQIENLRSKIRDFDLTICSGRIAIESILEGVQTVASGEHQYFGPVNPGNWKSAAESNFGDMGFSENAEPTDFTKIRNDFKSLLTSSQDPIQVQKNQEQLKDIIWNEFNDATIQPLIIELYKAAIFKRNQPQWIPALMYHRIPDLDPKSQHRIFVQKHLFEKHLVWLKQKQFTTMSFQDLLPFWDLQKPYSEFPKRPCLLTFDDGYLDNLTNLQPLLEKYQMRATIFLLADHSITENTWDSATGEPPAALMNLEQKKKLNLKHFEIGSHGFHHLHLNMVDSKTAFEEMTNSRIQLQKDLGIEPISFAYPFGSTNSQLAHACQKAGYRFAVNTDQGGLHLADNPFSIFRVNIFPEDGPMELRKKTAWWYRKYFYLKRGK